ncbi:MAG TPA: protein kinase [Kofleriaceae bacterium]|nr:protein kinase [Kofleriaceae bacterium]
MAGPEPWSSPVPLPSLTAADLARAGVVFEHGRYLYRTTGHAAGQGGMGHTFMLQMRMADRSESSIHRDEGAVAKVFHAEYLRQVRNDEVIRRDYECALHSLQAIARLRKPNILPVILSEPIVDNHLTITPLQAGTLRRVVTPGCLSQRRRVELLLGALRGLASLHEEGFIHRDFTLHNVLVDAAVDRTFVFDFDLTLSAQDYVGQSYRSLYQGRLFGSPGYSVPPEAIDPALMDMPVTPLLDVYAAGGAVFALFTDELPYGRTPDMWSLLLRITEGVVLDGRSRIAYPDAVPPALRPIIERCLERHPDRRYASVREVTKALEEVMPELTSDEIEESPSNYKTMRYADADERVRAVYEARPDTSVERVDIAAAAAALERQGYELRRAMGRVMGHPIYMAAPRPDLVALGQFPDTNTYPKLVTAIDIAEKDREHTIDLWIGGYLPILRAARQGMLTPLYKVMYDEVTSLLLLFSEYVDDVRFGHDLEPHDLSLQEAFGLGYVVARQVRRLHLRGMAHNNVSESSLLLKADRGARRALPAMVGIVSPTFDAEDIAADVRRLAQLVLSWMRPMRVLDGEAVHRERLADARQRLVNVAGGADACGIDGLVDLVADGLSVVDFNFGVLRESDGDLDAYALLLFGPLLYGRLWGMDR